MVGKRAPLKVAIVTVHGTGDTAPSEDGDKWFQRGSAFTEALKQRLAAKGLEPEIHPFLWSGANSAYERENGSVALAAMIRRLAPNYGGVHLIGHSHGGNVANDAALLLRWGRSPRRVSEPITSITTIGTPFLNRRAGTVQSVLGLAFLGVALASVPLYLIATLLAVLWASGVWDPLEISELLPAPGWMNWPIALAVIAPLGLALGFVLRLARRGWRQITRPRTVAGARATVFAVWHANDEAISFLQKIESLPLEPFPEGALLRSSRVSGTSLGVLTVVVGVLAPALILLGSHARLLDAPYATLYWLGLATTVLLLAAPMLFAFAYILVRGLAGSAGEVLARPRLNSWLADVLRGIAFGRDSGDSVGQVNTRSHNHATREYVLEGELAERMQANAQAAADQLIARYRWSLFSVGADTNGPLASLATDAMTWSSLIHTTYFDQPEVLSLVSDYIAEETVAPTRFDPVPPPPDAEAKPAPLKVFTRRRVVAAACAVVALVGVAGLLHWMQSGPVTASRQAQTRAEAPPATAPSAPHRIEAPAATAAFRDCAACPQMMSLRAGQFTMGAGDDDPERRPWEGPQRTVSVPAFAISTREVTFAEWDACVAAGGCARYAPFDRGWGRGDRPVIMVSWQDAQAYVKWLSAHTGHAYRLPSEAEWEYAARGGATTRYWWGAAFESDRTPKGATTPTASFGANGFGLYDVTGNVAEWVQDCYVNTYAGAPTDGKPVLAGNCAQRVVRGGSWRDGPSSLRITSRSRVDQTVRDGAIGFRVASR